MKLSIVLSLQPTSFRALAYTGNLEATIARLAELGYDGVELAVRDPSLLEADHVVQVVRAAGLAVPAIGTGQAYGEEGLSFTHAEAEVRRRAIARIRAQIDFAQPFEAQVIIGLIRGRVSHGVGREQAYTWLAEALRECAQYAAERGVALCLEPINRYETDLLNNVQETVSFLSEAGLTQVGLLYDTFHMNIEATSLAVDLVYARPYITHVHLADSNRCYPGAGHLDFAQIIGVLAALGYEGYLSAEILPRPSADRCAQETVRHLRPILERIRETVERPKR